MAEDMLTSAQVSEAARHIATLRGLYGDLGDAFNNRELRLALWVQIVSEQDQFAGLLREVNAG